MEVSTMLVGWGWTFDQIIAGWKETEALGFDAGYMGDDLFPHAFDEADFDAACFDPWTVLPAIAVSTSRMRIGTTVTPSGRRHPGLFAKMTSLVDVMSNGRLTVGMGAGNAPAQQKSLGQPFLTPAERVQMLVEELSILRAMWTEDRATFKGRYFQIEDAINVPKPVRKPHPEILLGFKSAKAMAPHVANFADRANVFAGDDLSLEKILTAVRAQCALIDRRFGDIVFSRCASLIFTTGPVDNVEAAIAARAQEIGMAPDLLLAEHKAVLSYVGPPEECAPFLLAKTEKLGIHEVVILIDTIDKNSYERTMAGLRTFARLVLPALKSTGR